MMSDSLVMLLLLPALLVCSAVASGSETALFRLTFRERADLRRTAPATGAAVEALLADQRRLLLLILIINMAVNTAYFVVSSMLTTSVESPSLGAAIGAGSVLAIVVFGEILAKVLAGTGRLGFCRVFARPFAALLALAGPLLNGIDRFVLSPLIRVVRPHADAASGVVGRDELRVLLESGSDQGVLRDSERRLLEEVIELAELRVREAMLPRDKIVWVEADASDREILDAASDARVTSLFMCRGGLDGVPVGFLHVKRYLAAVHASPGAGGATPAAEHCEPLLVIPEQARLDLVLDRMRTRGTPRAVCVDERGSVVGMIRASDIVDELLTGMGEQISDEKHAIHLVGLGVWAVRGSLNLRDWAQAFGIAEDGFAETLSRASTLGGLVLDRLGRLAVQGDTVEIGSARLTVTRVQGRRIEEIEVRLGGSPTQPQQPDRDGGQS